MQRIFRTALQKKSGFTLIEVIVGLVIVSIVLLVLYQFFGFSNKMFTRSEEKSDNQSQARLIIQGLRKDFSTAMDIDIVSVDKPDEYPVSAGEYTIYVKDGLLVRRDSIGNVTKYYSSYPVDFLSVKFSKKSDTLISIAVYVEGKLILDTDAAAQNMSTADPIDADNASPANADNPYAYGNLVVYTPSG